MSFILPLHNVDLCRCFFLLCCSSLLLYALNGRRPNSMLVHINLCTLHITIHRSQYNLARIGHPSIYTYCLYSSEIEQRSEQGRHGNGGELQHVSKKEHMKHS
jgi:hypothetical protein